MASQTMAVVVVAICLTHSPSRELLGPRKQVRHAVQSRFRRHTRADAAAENGDGKNRISKAELSRSQIVILRGDPHPASPARAGEESDEGTGTTRLSPPRPARGSRKPATPQARICLASSPACGRGTEPSRSRLAGEGSPPQHARPFATGRRCVLARASAQPAHYGNARSPRVLG